MKLVVCSISVEKTDPFYYLLRVFNVPSQVSCSIPYSSSGVKLVQQLNLNIQNQMFYSTNHSSFNLLNFSSRKWREKFPVSAPTCDWMRRLQSAVVFWDKSVSSMRFIVVGNRKPQDLSRSCRSSSNFWKA